jgi:hypothetical protein
MFTLAQASLSGMCSVAALLHPTIPLRGAGYEDVAVSLVKMLHTGTDTASTWVRPGEREGSVGVQTRTNSPQGGGGVPLLRTPPAGDHTRLLLASLSSCIIRPAAARRVRALADGQHVQPGCWQHQHRGSTHDQ